MSFAARQAAGSEGAQNPRVRRAADRSWAWCVDLFDDADGPELTLEVKTVLSFGEKMTIEFGLAP